MSQPRPGRSFVLSSERVEFGMIRPGDRLKRTITVTCRTSGPTSVQIAKLPAWLGARMEQRGDGKLAIEFALDLSQLPDNGSHSTVLDLLVGEETAHVAVALVASGLTKANRSDTSSGRRQPFKPHDAGQRDAASKRLEARIDLGRAAVNFGVLALLFSPVFTVTQMLLAAQPAAPWIAAGVTAGTALVFVIIGLIGARPTASQVLDPRTKNPQHQQLLAAVSELSVRAGIRPPRVALRADPNPNAFSVGLFPGLCCLYVNQGLLKVLTDRTGLQAVVAHEIAHVQRLDILFFALLTPVLKCARLAAAPLVGILFIGRRMAHSLNFGAMSHRVFRQMVGALNPSQMMGTAVVLMVIAVIVGLALMALSYAAVAVGGAVAALVACLGYARHLEAQADLRAAEILGDGDPLLMAMALCVDGFPTEHAAVNEFAAQYLEGVSEPVLADFVRAIKSGARVVASGRLADRYLRTHPPVVARMAFLIQKLGSRIA
jgi:Zn-dependent protease with chaperone function